MSTKIGPANQHDILHEYYGRNDCCLCKLEQANRELLDRIGRMESEIEELRSMVNKLFV